MASRSGNKFAAIFQAPAEPQSITELSATETVAPVPAASPEPTRIARAVGRPAGKRSDPAWKQFSILLRKDTQHAAIDILRKREEGDFSELVQRLVEQWVKQHRQ